MKSKAQEIINNLTSCSKSEYCKSEILDELLGLQGEMIAIAFPEADAAERSGLRLWDVVELLETRVAENGVGAEEVAAYKKSSKQVGNSIAGLFSGARGEKKAFLKLESLVCEKALVKNIGLEFDGIRTEIDCAVITPEGAFIVEVKNTKRDVFIDETGNAFRVGKFNRLDCNLLEKMRVREELLAMALEKVGFSDLPVKSLVVYTDSRIEVHNCCLKLTTCFLNQLPWFIKKLSGETVLSSAEIEQVRVGLEAIGIEWTYPMEVDIASFKQQFAEALVASEKVTPSHPSKSGIAAHLSAVLVRLAAAVNPEQQITVA